MNNQRTGNIVNKENNKVASSSDLLSALYRYTCQFLSDYELRGDNGDYTPSTKELILMQDSVCTLLEDEIFQEKFLEYLNSI